jgi:hypothetical protein
MQLWRIRQFYPAALLTHGGSEGRWKTQRPLSYPPHSVQILHRGEIFTCDFSFHAKSISGLRNLKAEKPGTTRK